MEWNIDFNRENNDKYLKTLGAKYKDNSDGECIGMFITLNSFEDFEQLQLRIEKNLGIHYSLIVDFAGKNIYIDKDL